MASCKLYFDITKHSRQSHFSGLNRVSSRLLGALGRDSDITLEAVRWSVSRRSCISVDSGNSIGKGSIGDIFFTPEVFALRERPFMRTWLRNFNGLTGCLFHDAIPFRHPTITWPKSVRRFPHLLAGLAEYKQVFYVSEQSRDDAFEAAAALGIATKDGPILTLGCDYRDVPVERNPTSQKILLHVGIVEPRKGQLLLLDACEELWKKGLQFKLVLIGRVNPHYGRPIVARIKQLRSDGRDVLHLVDAPDESLSDWHGKAALQVSPSFAEGFGLPILEALWAGCPVLATRQPSVNCVPGEGGIAILDSLDSKVIERELERLIVHDDELQRLTRQIDPGNLPYWKDTAAAMVQTFTGG